MSSVAFFEELAGRVGQLGFTDLVTHWPRADPPYVGDRDVLERVAGEVPMKEAQLDERWTGTRTRSSVARMTSRAALDRPIRVIQWTTGNIGRRSLHAILGRPTWSWSGSSRTARTRSAWTPPNSAGGPTPTGVSATNDIDALIALEPDACCYNPLWPSIDELVALLEAGINVCSSAAWITGRQAVTRGPRPDPRRPARQGNSTIFGSGAHPGMTNLVGMVLSGACERVDEIRITESVDCSTYESAGTQTAMGFSQSPDTPGLAENVRRESEVFAESAAMMADAIGVTLDRMTFDVDLHRGHRRQRPRLHDRSRRARSAA